MPNAEAAARKALNDAAAKLSAKRHPAAKTLAKEILSLLRNLSMPQTQLAFVLSPLETPGAHGGEDIALKFSTQENAPLKNIAEIASGGELSRLGLAVQIAAGRFRPRPVVIFDEVDSGIGGAPLQSSVACCNNWRIRGKYCVSPIWRKCGRMPILTGG